MLFRSPYCEYYTAYPIAGGTLSFENDTRIVDNRLNSTNTIDIYNMVVDPKVSGQKPKVNVPLRTALYILTDRKGNIKFDVPVKGNITDPEFKYGKIIWQTLMNLFVKVSLSPASFIANSLGIGNKVTDKIAIDAMAMSFTSAQYASMNQIKEIYDAKPDIEVKMMQYVDTTFMLGRMAVLNVKRDYYLHHNNDSTLALDDVGVSRLAEISDNNKEFEAYLNRLLEQAGAQIGRAHV